MATTYVVLREVDGVPPYDVTGYIEAGRTEANTPTQARRLVAETLPEEDVDAGVILHAVPARNWDGGKGREQAETTRRIRSA
jgi:hypothetical protein